MGWTVDACKLYKAKDNECRNAGMSLVLIVQLFVDQGIGVASARSRRRMASRPRVSKLSTISFADNTALLAREWGQL